LFPGIGTVVNAASVLVGTTIGVLVGHRLGQRTRDVVTDGIGLVTLLIAATSAAAVTHHSFSAAVGDSAPTLIVLGSIVLGGIIGSLLGIERRLEGFGGWLQDLFGRWARRSGGGDGSVSEERLRFIEGFVNSSLVFCAGPLTVLGSLNDGLDGFTAIAFAASFGWGVAASVVSLFVVQGSLTVVGALLGGVLPDAEIAALTATGGLMLVGVAFRLLRIKQLPVGDLLPGLVVAPLLTAIVAAFH
jgi:uncharacterized membrane protein YqgA involved in biofilm formation